jgi:hypothetical protein
LLLSALLFLSLPLLRLGLSLLIISTPLILTLLTLLLLFRLTLLFLSLSLLNGLLLSLLASLAVISTAFLTLRWLRRCLGLIAPATTFFLLAAVSAPTLCIDYYIGGEDGHNNGKQYCELPSKIRSHKIS